MLKYCHTTLLVKNILPQFNSIHNNTLNGYRNKTVSNPYTNVNPLISRNLFSAYSISLYCYFSTINKKNFNKQQIRSNNNKQKKDQSLQQQKTKKQTHFNNKQKHQNFNSKQHKHKNKQTYSKQTSKQQSKQQSQQQIPAKYEMSPDILEFNKQVSLFIQNNLPKVRGVQQQQEQLKITSNFLSNLYKFINLKGDFLQVNPQRSLSPQNRKKISELIKLKQRSQLNNNKQRSQLNNNNNNDNSQQESKLIIDEQKILTYHQQLCNVLYLCSIISDKKRFGNIVNEFLSLLSLMNNKSFLTSKKQAKFRFVMNEQQLKRISNHQNKQILYLPVIVSKIFPPTLFIRQDILPLQIIKAVAQKRSTQELLTALRCLSKLLTIKQLKTLDTLIEEHFLAPTEYKIKKEIKAQNNNYGFNNQNNNNQSYVMNENKVMSLEQLGRLASILSQLNLNGVSIRACQNIFSLILNRQTIGHTQTLQTLIQQILSSQQRKQQISMSLVINLPITQIKFDLLIKFYIALAEIGGVDAQFNYLVQKLLVTKFRIRHLIDSNKQLIKDTNVWRQLNTRYCINSKQITILLGTMHKFKKGNQVMIMPTFMNKENNIKDQVNKDNNNRDSINDKIELRHTNIWLQIYRYYRQVNNSIPNEFIFPLLSGMYRSYNSFIINEISSYYQKRSSLQKVNEQIQRVGSIISRLTLRLYEVDKEISYLEQLQLEKLIQLVIVVNLGANLIVSKNINKIMNNTNKDHKNNKNKENKDFKDSKNRQIKGLKDVNAELSYEFINRLLQQMNKRQQQQKHNQFPQQQEQQDHNNQQSKQMSKFNSNDEQSMMLSPQLIKQQDTVHSILQFYLLFTKAHLQLFTSKNTQQLIKKNNKQQAKNNKQLGNKKLTRNNISLSLQQVLKQIRSILKKNRVSQQTTQLISIIIKNTIKLTEYLKNYEQQTSSQSNKQNLSEQIGQSLQRFGYGLQSFIGFNSQQLLSQYQHQLQTNLIKSIFPYLQDQSPQQQSILEPLTKRLIKPDSKSKQPFIMQKLIINNILLSQQIIRINLINNQEDFRMYSHHLKFDNLDLQQ